MWDTSLVINGKNRWKQNGKAPCHADKFGLRRPAEWRSAGEGMGECWSRREQVSMQQAVLLGLGLQKMEGERGCSSCYFQIPLSALPLGWELFPVSLPPSHYTVGCLPGKGCAPAAPRMCCRGSGGGGGGPLTVRCSWEERAGAGPEVRFAFLWERVNWEGGRYHWLQWELSHISNMKVQWINEPSLEVKMLAICFGGEKG